MPKKGTKSGSVSTSTVAHYFPHKKIIIGVIVLVLIMSAVYFFLKKRESPQNNTETGNAEPNFVNESLATELETEGRTNQDQFNDHLFRAENYVKADNIDAAREHAHIAEGLVDTSDYISLLRLSQVFSLIGDVEKSNSLLVKASEQVLSNDDAALHMQMYTLLIAADKTDQAAKHYDRAKEIDSAYVRSF